MVYRRRFALEELEMEDELCACMWISLLCVVSGFVPAVLPVAKHVFGLLHQLALPARSWSTGRTPVRSSAFLGRWASSDSYAISYFVNVLNRVQIR
jgi:hypothetical protein